MANAVEKPPLPPDRVNTGPDNIYQPLNRPNPAQVHPQTQHQYPQQQYPQQPYPQQPVPQTSAYQQPQAIYIQSMPSAPRHYQNYNGKLSVIFGAINIVLVTISIILNGVGFHLQIGRHSFLGNVAILMCPAAFCGFFVYLSASFAIAAGQFKNRCLIISHLVLAIIGDIFAFTFVAFSFGALPYEVSYNNHNYYDHNYYREDQRAADMGSMAIVILWILMSIAIFVMNTWGAALCCRVLCCGAAENMQEGVVVMTTQGQGINAPAGGVVIQQNPTALTAPSVTSEPSAPPAYEQ